MCLQATETADPFEIDETKKQQDELKRKREEDDMKYYSFSFILISREIGWFWLFWRVKRRRKKTKAK
jgi:hypothetical protein